MHLSAAGYDELGKVGMYVCMYVCVYTPPDMNDIIYSFLVDLYFYCVCMNVCIYTMSSSYLQMCTHKYIHTYIHTSPYIICNIFFTSSRLCSR